jgi:hypothetical protein
VCEKDSGVWAEARKLARTAVFSSPSRERDLLIWVDVDKSSSHQLSQNEIASDNPCCQHLSKAMPIPFVDRLLTVRITWARTGLIKRRPSSEIVCGLLVRLHELPTRLGRQHLSLRGCRTNHENAFRVTRYLRLRPESDDPDTFSTGVSYWENRCSNEVRPENGHAIWLPPLFSRKHSSQYADR